MAEVPDHLVPTDGLTNASIRLAGFDLLESGEQIVRFNINDENRRLVAVFAVDVGHTNNGNADTVLADGHARMRDVLRQWLHTVDKMEQFYRRQAQRTGDGS